VKLFSEDGKLNQTEQKIADIATPVVEDMGFELLYVTLKGQENDHILEIVAENPETKNLGVDECARISRAVAAVLDVEDPIKSAYRLELSSPGIDRKLIRLKDFSTYAGLEAKIEINPTLDDEKWADQKRFRGILEGEKDGFVLLKTEDKGDVQLPFTSIQKAKLVMNDELIKKTALKD
jgi:ribosome maturation factor RimP